MVDNTRTVDDLPRPRSFPLESRPSRPLVLFDATPTTGIKWTTHSWNPVSGCSEVSPGCDNCYARVLSERRRGTKAFPDGFDVTLRPHKLREPLSWRKPARIFVNSMSDLFHRKIPDDYLRQVWDTMLAADHHIYQILTKRAERMRQKIEDLNLELAAHIWLGVSAENQKFADSRIPSLVRIDPEVRFVSAEPLLGPIDFTRWCGQLDWIIVGGESGSPRRPMDYDWARSIRDQCAEADVAFFYKQGNAFRPGQDTQLDGLKYEEFPG